MTIVRVSELIEELQKLKLTHGNLEVVNDEDDYITVEFSPETPEGNAAFVIG